MGFQVEGMGAKVRLRVAKDGAREVGKDWSTEDGEIHLVDICFLFSFVSLIFTKIHSNTRQNITLYFCGICTI